MPFLFIAIVLSVAPFQGFVATGHAVYFVTAIGLPWLGYGVEVLRAEINEVELGWDR